MEFQLFLTPFPPSQKLCRIALLSTISIQIVIFYQFISNWSSRTSCFLLKEKLIIKNVALIHTQSDLNKCFSSKIAKQFLPNCNPSQLSETDLPTPETYITLPQDNPLYLIQSSLSLYILLVYIIIIIVLIVKKYWTVSFITRVENPASVQFLLFLSPTAISITEIDIAPSGSYITITLQMSYMCKCYCVLCFKWAHI